MRLLMRLLVIASTLLLAQGQSSAYKPGVKIRVTNKGINYVNSVGKTLARKLLEQLQFKDIAGKQDKLEYSLSNIVITGLTGPETSLVNNPDLNAITLSITNFGVTLSTDWWAKYKLLFIPLSASGGLVASVSDVSLTLTVGVDVDPSTLYPVARSRGCTVSIGGVKFNFNGGTAWLLNLLKGVFENLARNVLGDKICVYVNNFIDNDVTKKLQDFKMVAGFLDKFVLDYSLVAPVNFNSLYIETQHKGEVYWKDDLKTESPFTPSLIPSWTDNSNMAYLWVTEYTIMTLAYVAHTHDYLKYTLTPDKLPASSKGYLNTTCPDSVCAGSLLNQISTAYPNSQVTINIISSAVPKVNITTTGLQLTINGAFELSVLTPSGSVQSAITSNVALSLSATASIANQAVTGNVTNFSVKLDGLKSNIGDLDQSELNTMIYDGINMIVIPQINAIAQAGVPLPSMKDVTLSNSKATFLDGVLVLSSDARYKDIV
ncbi:unnamed protein product [Lymnaea stagnalis]|uniref:Uncharacterized protein n=1 Tax=Lymnaea stagnalis TaxID=6523 RepID=A0AAV2IGE8_LYMST